MYLKSIIDYLNYEPNFSEDPQELVDEIKSYASTYISTEHIHHIQDTYEFVRDAHKGQKRVSGEPYIIHPIMATQYLMNMKPGIVTIQTCLLHDVIEDTTYTTQDVEKRFGKEVSGLCEGLVKVSKIKYRGEERQLETLKKTFLAMASDLRVIFVKVSDRVHNIQTLKYLPSEEKKQRIADETMKIYVPICKRLGLYHYQTYLENGCFYVNDYYACLRIVRYMQKNFGSDSRYIERGIKKIANILAKEKITDFDVKGRMKSPYRVHDKMTRKYQNYDLSKVMDLLAFRIIVKSVGDCYNVLGVMHKHFTPLINKIKDYISLPKANGYRSLHTTLVGMFNFPIEIQIRTGEMDDVAEYGVAAHFEYSDTGESTKSISASQLKWIKKLQDVVASYQEMGNKEGFKAELNIELLNKSKFVYTPRGDVVEMPQGATILDFAFRIHSLVGMRFKNGIVNGVIKPIGYVPKTGDVITINTFKNKYTATKYWMDFLHTPSAKNKLLRFLKSKQKQELLTRSVEKLNKRLKERKLPLLYSPEDRISKKYIQDELEKKLLLMLDKQESYSTFCKDLYPKKRKELYKPKEQVKQLLKGDSVISIIIDDNKQLPYTLCELCKPKASEKLIARSGKDGIKIHNLDCKGIKTVAIQKLLETHRSNQIPNTYSVTLELETIHTHANLMSVISVFADLHIAMDNISIQSNGVGMSLISVQSAHANPAKIHFLINALKRVDTLVKITKTIIS